MEDRDLERAGRITPHHLIITGGIAILTKAGQRDSAAIQGLAPDRALQQLTMNGYAGAYEKLISAPAALTGRQIAAGPTSLAVEMRLSVTLSSSGR
jgi:hypothetical protein